MEDRQRFKAEMFVRVDELGVAEAASFPATSLGGQLFADLKALIAELNDYAARQSSGRTSAEQGASTKSEAREALKDDLEAISRTARAMSEEVGGLEDKFRLPRGNSSDQALIAAARAFAADALPLRATFIAYEMPADFLDDLNDDIKAFEAAVNAQATGRREHVTATAAIDDIIERGMQIARRLDAIVRNKFSDQPAKLAAWLSARHIQRVAHHKKTTPPPNP